MNDEKLEFLDTLAQQIFQAQRNTYHNLHWQREKWVLDSSSEYEKVYLWTFAGDKINRAISVLLSTKIENEPSYDYMKVTIDLEKEEPKSLGDIHDLISSFKSKTEQELEDKAEDKINVKWFSKFSECLPVPLAKKAILEKGIDFPGLIRELNLVRIE
jgi:ATP-dependent Lhr-like helicase